MWNEEVKMYKEKNHRWKGDNVSLRGLHTWIRKNFGKANHCEYIYCQGKSKSFDWANITGIYNRDICNYKQLCRGCHIKLDRYNSIQISIN